MTSVIPDLADVLVILCGILGLIIGSFLNVVVWRLPRGESLSHPGSACPNCGHAIRWWDNIPVLSWVLLRAKCRDCGVAISARYPAVEIATGGAFAIVVAWRLTVDANWLESGASFFSAVSSLAAFLYLAAISVALAIIDLENHKLPNRIVLPAYGVAIVLLSAASLLAGNFDSLLRGAIGLAVMFAAYFAMALVYPGGMGFGDVKLAGVLGLYLGWTSWAALAVGAFAAFVLGAAFSVVLLILRRANRKSGIPFGPWMLLGCWVGLLVGGPLAAAYLSLFELGM